MNIVTWNINHRGNNSAWNYSLNDLKGDLIFLQECHNPNTYIDRIDFNKSSNNTIWEPTNNGWGNAILFNDCVLPIRLLTGKFKGRLIVGSIKYNSEVFTVINFHTPITGYYSRYNLEAMLDIVSPFLNDSKCILCGDLNFGPCFDYGKSTDCQDFFNNLLSTYGLHDCLTGKQKRIVQTYRPIKKPESIIGIDYIFVTKDIAHRVEDCHVETNEIINKLSDHHPVIATLI